MPGVGGALSDWRSRDGVVALATVAEVRGSAPQPVGARMAVSVRGEIEGAVAGGCVEGAVVERCLALLRDGGGPEEVWLGVAAEPLGDVVLGCGGEILVRVELVSSASDVVEPEVVSPRLVLVGAVDVAPALCRLAVAAGWSPVVVEPRTLLSRGRDLPAATLVLEAWPARAFASLDPALGPGDAVAVLTHDPKLDDEALTCALAAGAGYVGAMGSRAAHARRCDRLCAAGVDAAAVARVRGPIGLDLGGTGAEQTALAIMAEVVAASHGRAGGPLAGGAGPIHRAAPRVVPA